MKFGCYFPAFSFFSEQYFGIFMKTIMGTANMKFSKTAHIIQLSIHVSDAMVPIMVFIKIPKQCSLKNENAGK